MAYHHHHGIAEIGNGTHLSVEYSFNCIARSRRGNGDTGIIDAEATYFAGAKGNAHKAIIHRPWKAAAVPFKAGSQRALTFVER